jgi:hypothetical protein
MELQATHGLPSRVRLLSGNKPIPVLNKTGGRAASKLSGLDKRCLLQIHTLKSGLMQGLNHSK